MLKNCAQDSQVGIPISGIGGVENWRDAAEFILLGASSVQVCTAVMHYGFGIIRDLKSGLERYMDEKGFKTLDDFRGKALPNIVHWEDLNLKYKVVAEINADKCIGCQLCYTACEDGAHQAIGLSSDPADPHPEHHRGELRGLQSLLHRLSLWRTASPWSAAMMARST
jgi:dihydropyrimidine dehydrogenase (NAD+) subunit PreA